MTLTLPHTDPADIAAPPREVHAARELYRDRGWLEKPLSYHVRRRPRPIPRSAAAACAAWTTSTCASRAASSRAPREPRPRQLARGGANRTAHAWAFRHADPSRPWLVCIHGYQMGCRSSTSSAFEAGRLHRARG